MSDAPPPYDPDAANAPPPSYNKDKSQFNNGESQPLKQPEPTTIPRPVHNPAQQPIAPTYHPRPEGGEEAQPLKQNIAYVHQPINQATQLPPNVILHQVQTQPPVPVIQQTASSQPVKAAQATDPKKGPRIAVTVIGFIAGLLLFIALCLDNLAHYESYGQEEICGFTHLQVEYEDAYYWWYWWGYLDGDYAYADYCDSSNPDACNTMIGAILALITLLLALFANIFGVVLIQPWKDIKRCCFETTDWFWSAQLYFCISLVMSLLSIILWAALDEICLTDDGFMELGGTMICNIVAMVFTLIAIIVGLATKVGWE